MNSEFESTITFVNNDANSGNFVQSVTPSPEAVYIKNAPLFCTITR